MRASLAPRGPPRGRAAHVDRQGQHETRTETALPQTTWVDDPWAAVAATSSLVSALVVIVAVLYTRSQLREAARARSVAVALDIRARHEVTT